MVNSLKKKSPSVNRPSGIVFYDNNLYIIDQKNVSIFDLQFQLLSSFPVPESSAGFNNLKVDADLIYITIHAIHLVFIYTKDGKLKHTIGSSIGGSKMGEFHIPYGLTVDTNTLYVCDFNNNRIQTFSKVDYSFCKQWGNKGTDKGQFNGPYSISYYQDILYIGDDYCLQLFTCDGICLQRIGGDRKETDKGYFNEVGGTCVVGDQLFVSDFGRVQVFNNQ